MKKWAVGDAKAFMRITPTAGEQKAKIVRSET